MVVPPALGLMAYLQVPKMDAACNLTLPPGNRCFSHSLQAVSFETRRRSKTHASLSNTSHPALPPNLPSLALNPLIRSRPLIPGTNITRWQPHLIIPSHLHLFSPRPASPNPANHVSRALRPLKHRTRSFHTSNSQRRGRDLHARDVSGRLWRRRGWG